MKEFKKYQHIERFGTTEVENIELGEVYVFPKIDGTNASVWLDENGDVQAGSRRRHLTLESDNAGFYAWVKKQKNITEYLKENPTHRLYGEWLVPHALKTYRDDSWRRFYVFDVCIDIPEEKLSHEFASDVKYIPYEDYKEGLEIRGIDYVIPISKITNASKDQLFNQLHKNTFLIKDGEGVGEGVVLKNYNWKNKYDRQVWAKIVSSEFKEKHTKEHGTPELKGKNLIEASIVDKYVTKALCEKVYAKIELDSGFTSKQIPRLLNTIYYDLVREETWSFVKENKNPVLDFSKLKFLTNSKVKEHLPHLF